MRTTTCRTPSVKRGWSAVGWSAAAAALVPRAIILQKRHPTAAAACKLRSSMLHRRGRCLHCGLGWRHQQPLLPQAVAEVPHAHGLLGGRLDLAGAIDRHDKQALSAAATHLQPCLPGAPEGAEPYSILEFADGPSQPGPTTATPRPTCTTASHVPSAHGTYMTSPAGLKSTCPSPLLLLPAEAGCAGGGAAEAVVRTIFTSRGSVAPAGHRSGNARHKAMAAGQYPLRTPQSRTV